MNIDKYITSDDSFLAGMLENTKLKIAELRKDHEKNIAKMLELDRIRVNLARDYNFSEEILKGLNKFSAYCEGSLKIKMPDIKTALTFMKTIETQLLEIVAYKDSCLTYQPRVLEYRDEQAGFLKYNPKKTPAGSYLYHVKGYRSTMREEHSIEFFLSSGDVGAGANDIIDCTIELDRPWDEYYRETEWKHHSTKYSTSPTRVATYLHNKTRPWFNHKQIWGACSDQPNSFTLSHPVFNDLQTFIDEIEWVEKSEQSGVGVEVDGLLQDIN